MASLLQCAMTCTCWGIASPLGSRKLKYVLPQGEEALLCILLSNTGILHCKQVNLLSSTVKELQHRQTERRHSSVLRLPHLHYLVSDIRIHL